MLRAWLGRLKQVLDKTERAFEDLRLLAGLVERIERERFQTPHMRALVEKLRSHDVPAATAIAKLATVVQLVESRRNPLLQVLEVPLMYSVHVARAAEGWRRAHGAAVRGWLDVIGEVEALLSLAAYSYEHPDDPFPEFLDGPASLSGESLGHPLIPAARCVRNDVGIELPVRALLVSGSNMSGKSTLLRTVGINTVLAMAGSTVRAKRLQLTPLQVGASIRINDSLHEGSSRFYAEITRLRQLHELSARMPPLLFLLDELLQGTNSRDRHIGAEGVLRALLARGAIGFISTHDLGPHGHRRGRRLSAAQRPFSGRARRRPHDVRFQASRRDRDQKQWNRADALHRFGRIASQHQSEKPSYRRQESTDAQDSQAIDGRTAYRQETSGGECLRLSSLRSSAFLPRSGFHARRAFLPTAWPSEWRIRI